MQNDGGRAILHFATIGIDSKRLVEDHLPALVRFDKLDDLPAGDAVPEWP